MLYTKEVCNDCFNRIFTETEFLNEMMHWAEPEVWEVEYGELAEGANKGCPICKIHLDAAHQNPGMERQGGEIPEAIDISQQVFYISKDNDKHLDHYELDLSRLVVSGQTFDLFTHEDDPASRYISSRGNKPRMTIETIVSQIHKWVEECNNGHGRSHCSCQLYEIAELPPRVIEVSLDDDSNLHAKLVEPRGSVEKYVALSYCWGEEQWNPTRTTKETYRQHCEKIPVNSLASTLSDAILLTCRLGLKYIWIDALCIIQDSHSDKDLQISKMRSIFENSFITLVAAAGANASAGFLSQVTQQPPKRDITFYLPFEPAANDVKGRIYAARAENADLLDNQPVDQRAWTLEERLLSSRKVFFFGDRLGWECKDTRLSMSTGFGARGVDMRLSTVVVEAEQVDRRSDWGTTANDMSVIHEAWTRCVQWYTARELTHPLDKLRAIGGIAQKFHVIFHRVLGIDYLAGLWAGLVSSGLLWRRVSDGQVDPLRSRPSIYRAPSWSWAAIDGKVEYEVPDAEEGSLEVARLHLPRSISATVKPTIIEQHIDLASPSKPFGGVIGGHLKLEGMIKHVEGHLERATHDELGDILRIDLERDPTGRAEKAHVDCWLDTIGELSPGSAQLSLLGLTGAAEVIGSSPGSKSPFGSYMLVVRGIIIREDVEREAFSRMGYFEFWHYDYHLLMSGFETKAIHLV